MSLDTLIRETRRVDNGRSTEDINLRITRFHETARDMFGTTLRDVGFVPGVLPHEIAERSTTDEVNSPAAVVRYRDNIIIALVHLGGNSWALRLYSPARNTVYRRSVFTTGTPVTLADRRLALGRACAALFDDAGVEV